MYCEIVTHKLNVLQMAIVNNYYLFINFYLFCFYFYYFLMKGFKMKSPIKLRYVLLVAVIAFAFNGINNSLKRSDYHHCTVTSKMTSEQCQAITGYQLNK